jgi:two-component system phosphate regulon sensor histidine kinase PhoR
MSSSAAHVMDRPPALRWPVLSALAAAAAAWAATANARLTGAVALAAALSGGLTAWQVSRAWRRRADAYAAAARGVVIAPDGDSGEPAALAQAVQRTAADARELGRRLAVLRGVIDGMREGVWITSEDGTVVEHNNALKELLYTGQQIVGQQPLELLRSVELQRAVEQACRDSVSSNLELTVEGVRPAVLSVHVSPLGRELGGSAAVFFDVTELRRLEKVRKDFVANVSHELRTPITAIRGYAETLQAGALKDPDNAPRMVDIIHRQAERLSELVEDLLELSRLESRQLQLAEAPVDLAEAARQALEAVRPKAEARGTRLELQIAPGVRVLGDRRAVEQIVLNLVDNAVKYTPPNGHVWVGAQPGDGAVQLSVRDDGPGIEPRHLPRLFERFYRVDKGRSRDMGGTGLGLSIVKHLATAMKGDVRVESEPRGGSTFFVQLPAAPADAEPPRAA